jgi:hypothetical protein
MIMRVLDVPFPVELSEGVMTMKYVASSAALLGVLLFASLAVAGEPCPNYENHKFLERMVGKWTQSGEIDGKKMTGEFIAKWAPKKHCLFWTSKVWPVESPNEIMFATGLHAWDSKKERLKEVAFGSNGASFTTFFKVDGDKLLGEREATNPDGTTWYVSGMVFAFDKNRIVCSPGKGLDAQGNVVTEFADWVFVRVESNKK